MSTTAEPLRKKSSAYRSKSIKPPAVQSEIIARRVAGQNKSSIARDLGITKNTVSSVLALNDIDQMFEDGRLGTMKRIPKALKTLDVRLEKNSENAALWVLDKCFDNNKVTGGRMTGDTVLNQTLNVLLRGETQPGEPAKVDGETRTVEIKTDTPDATEAK